MVVRFLTGRFIWEYSAEERLYIHRCSIDCDSDHDGSDVVLEILDTESKVSSFPNQTVSAGYKEFVESKISLKSCRSMYLMILSYIFGPIQRF